MNTFDLLKLLRDYQEEDEKFSKEMFKKHGAATFCCMCKKNTYVGSTPFWHKFSRSLCDNCGREYADTLKQLRAWEF